MSDETTLLSCPFCGGEAELKEYKPNVSGVAICGECGARSPICKNNHEGGWQPKAIAAWNTRAAKPCYAAEDNYKWCKYGTNRGWCDNSPFLVWDDTGHLFITLGGLKTWDVTDDAKKWFAEPGSGACKPVETETLENVTAHVMECDECGGTYEHVNGDYERCPHCGAEVVER